MSEIRFGNLIFIPGPNKARYPFCNSLYIDDERKAIIDPASDETVLKKLKEKGMDVIINSHYHEDHFLFNYLFPEAKFYIHKDDAPCFKSRKQLYYYWGLDNEEQENSFTAYFEAFHYKERVPDFEFSDGDILDFGYTKLKVIHTPGHTPGHSAFYCKEEGVLFMCDFDLNSFGPWYGDRFSDIDQTIESMNKLLSIPAEIYITSHDAGIIKGDIKEKAGIFMDIIRRRESDILEFIQKPKTFEEIIDKWIIYQKPREPKEFWQFAEKATVKKHLEYAIKNGKVQYIDNKYSVI